MTSIKAPSYKDIVSLSQHTQKSLAQLQAIGALPLPSDRYTLVNKLIRNSQTYLVFLEESAGLIRAGDTIDGTLLDAIKMHCDCVENAWLEMKDEIAR